MFPFNFSLKGIDDVKVLHDYCYEQGQSEVCEVLQNIIQNKWKIHTRILHLQPGSRRGIAGGYGGGGIKVRHWWLGTDEYVCCPGRKRKYFESYRAAVWDLVFTALDSSQEGRIVNDKTPNLVPESKGSIKWGDSSDGVSPNRDYGNFGL